MVAKGLSLLAVPLQASEPLILPICHLLYVRFAHQRLRLMVCDADRFLSVSRVGQRHYRIGRAHDFLASNDRNI